MSTRFLVKGFPCLFCELKEKITSTVIHDRKTISVFFKTFWKLIITYLLLAEDMAKEDQFGLLGQNRLLPICEKLP